MFATESSNPKQGSDRQRAEQSVVTFSLFFFLSPTFLCLFCLVILTLLPPSPCFSHPFAVISYFCLLLTLGTSLPCFPRALAADEMTVGKVYAALMIFDFYKQNKNSREQVQPPGGLCQVQKVSFHPPSWAAFTGITSRIHPEGLAAPPGRV